MFWFPLLYFKKVEFFVPKIAEMVYNGAQLLQRCETLWTYNFNPIRVDFHQKKNYHFFAFMMLHNKFFKEKIFNC